MKLYTYIKENVINEVRLPNGYFKVVNSFILKGEDDWDITFMENQIIQIDTENKKINNWNTTLEKWTKSGISYSALMLSQNYSIFKTNTIKIDINKLPKTAIPLDSGIHFTTTVKQFNKKADDEGLNPNDKISVKAL